MRQFVLLPLANKSIKVDHLNISQQIPFGSMVATVSFDLKHKGNHDINYPSSRFAFLGFAYGVINFLKVYREKCILAAKTLVHPLILPDGSSCIPTADSQAYMHWSRNRNLNGVSNLS